MSRSRPSPCIRTTCAAVAVHNYHMRQYTCLGNFVSMNGVRALGGGIRLRAMDMRDLMNDWDKKWERWNGRLRRIRQQYPDESWDEYMRRRAVRADVGLDDDYWLIRWEESVAMGGAMEEEVRVA